MRQLVRAICCTVAVAAMTACGSQGPASNPSNSPSQPSVFPLTITRVGGVAGFNDVLVVATGCSALASARAGLLRPEAALEMAGPGLREVCEAVGIPPVLHLGACVDNTRILLACCNMLVEGGLGQDLSDLPVAGAAPEWMSEKAITIGMYAVGSGIYTVFGNDLAVSGAPALRDYLTSEMENEVGATWAFEQDAVEAAHLMMERMNGKRKDLKLRDMLYSPTEPAAVGV